MLVGSDQLLQEVDRFLQAIQNRFKVGRINHKKFVFNRLLITQTQDYSISVHMQEFMETISPIPLSKTRCKEHEGKCTTQELMGFLSLAGKLNYIGHGVLPPSSLFSSKLQECIGDLRVFHLKEANVALVQVKRLCPTLEFKSIENSFEALKSAHLLSFSDTSTGASSYGQTGFLTGPFFHNSTFHTLGWYSGKQNRVSFSSVGA